MQLTHFIMHQLKTVYCSKVYDMIHRTVVEYIVSNRHNVLCKDIWAAELRIKELRIIYYEYIYYIIYA